MARPERLRLVFHDVFRWDYTIFSSMNNAIAQQRELFSLFDEFFQRSTGKTARGFAALDEFSETVPSLKTRAAKTQEAFKWGMPRLYALYARQKTDLFAAAGQQGGLKVVLGGGSHFGKTQLNAVRRFLLYADTVLIPDPVFALIETDRPEEKFPHVRLLEAMFFALRLKPFVDSDCAYPPIILFPSYERSLAKHDPTTQARLDHFHAGIFSQFLGRPFPSGGDVARYASEEGHDFLSAVASKKLFVAPNGPLDEPLDAAIERYRKEVRIWRTGGHLDLLEHLTDSQLVCNAILERLEPQYHLIENATELRAQPLLSIEQQAYYFKLCASATEDFLEDHEVISPATRATIEALSQQQFEWLSNAGVDALVEMRLNNENARFRDQLSKATSELNEASLSDLNRVSSEVARGIGGLLNEHRQSARKLEEKYKPKYGSLAAAGWVSCGALLLPHLSPLIASIPGITLAGKYVQTKVEQRREKRELASSLLGILATATNASDNVE